MAAERLRLLEETTKRLEEKIEAEARLSVERDKRYAERFAAQENAGIYQREITNEFRGQLRDQAEKFITRTESLARAQANADKIDQLATRMDRNEGRSTGLSAGWAALVGAVSLLGAIIAIVFALRG